MRLWIIVTVLLAGNLAHAEESFDSVFARLAKVDQFAIGGVGYAGVISQGEKDYKFLLSRPSALTGFERLLAEGNPQAKCYAFFAIHALSPNRFKVFLQSLRYSEEQVAVQSGCLSYRESLGAVLKGIEKGQYREMKAAKSSS